MLDRCPLLCTSRLHWGQCTLRLSTSAVGSRSRRGAVRWGRPGAFGGASRSACRQAALQPVFGNSECVCSLPAAEHVERVIEEFTGSFQGVDRFEVPLSVTVCLLWHQGAISG